MKRLLIFLLSFFIFLLLSGCSEDDNPTKAENLDSNLLGEWVFVDSNNDVHSWTFNEDGTCIQTLYNQDFNWEWQIEDGQIKLFISGAQAVYYNYRIEGNKLYLRVDSMDEWSLPYTKA